MDMGLAYTEEVEAVKFYDSPREWLSDKADEDKKQKTTLNLVGQLYSGSPKQKQEAADFLLSTSGGTITDIDVTDDGVTVVYADGGQKDMQFGAMTGSQWVTGNTNNFLSADNAILDAPSVIKQTIGTLAEKPTEGTARSYTEQQVTTDNSAAIAVKEEQLVRAIEAGNEPLAAALGIELKKLQDADNKTTVTTPGFIGAGAP